MTAQGSIDGAVEALLQGKIVVAVNDLFDGGAHLVMAAQYVSPRAITFLGRRGRGPICVVLSPDRCEELAVQPISGRGPMPISPPFSTSIDARDVSSTGVSSTDRAHTIKLAADPTVGPERLVRPGHVFALRPRDGGVLQTPGVAEAAIDIVKIAGLAAAAVTCEIVIPRSERASGQLESFCAKHGLLSFTVSELIACRRRQERRVERLVIANLPTVHGTFEVFGYRALHDDSEHLALVRGNALTASAPLVHVHPHCQLADVFRSTGCDCRARLEQALEQIAAAPGGIVVYVRAPHDDPSPRHRVGEALRWAPPVPELAAEILVDLGIRSMSLTYSQPGLAIALRERGLTLSAPSTAGMKRVKS